MFQIVLKNVSNVKCELVLKSICSANCAKCCDLLFVLERCRNKVGDMLSMVLDSSVWVLEVESNLSQLIKHEHPINISTNTYVRLHNSSQAEKLLMHIDFDEIPISSFSVTLFFVGYSGVPFTLTLLNCKR
jgi:hypothetical protein